MAFGPRVRKVLSALDATSIPVAGVTTVYTKVLELQRAQYFAVRLRATSATGSPKVTITVEQSDVAPTTEGVADTNYVTPNGFSAIVTDRTAQTWYIATISPVTMKYLRFKITGGSGNAADTLVEINCSIQED